MTPQEINKRFAELAGICWHYYSTFQTVRPICVKCGAVNAADNPDFCADPRLVLEVMMKREDWDKFGKAYLTYIPIQFLSDFNAMNYHISMDYILDITGLLALTAIDFLQQQQNERLESIAYFNLGLRVAV